MFFNSFFTDSSLQALCRTFIHSLWQGVIAAILAGFILLFTRKSSALLRYNLLGLVLSGLVLTNILTLIRELRFHSAIGIQAFTIEASSRVLTSMNDNGN